MDNPYKAQDSELVSNHVIQDYKNLRWKILFFILLPLEVWSQYDAFIVNDLGDSLGSRIISLLVYSFFFIGLFGLAFKRVYFTEKLWLCFLPVMIVSDCIELFPLLQDTSSEDISVTIIAMAVISPLLVISWYAVFKYSRVLRPGLTIQASVTP